MRRSTIDGGHTKASLVESLWHEDAAAFLREVSASSMVAPSPPEPCATRFQSAPQQPPTVGSAESAEAVSEGLVPGAGAADATDEATVRACTDVGESQLSEAVGAAAPSPPPTRPRRAADATVTLLVEYACHVSSGMSTNHDVRRYEEYYDRVRALEGTLLSPCGRHSIDVRVEALRSDLAEAHAAAAVWDYDDGMEHDDPTWRAHDRFGSDEPVALPVASPRRAHTALHASRGRHGLASSRLGAFEVYLLTHLPDVPSIPQLIGLHSKLSGRRWPNVHTLAQRCRRAVAPAFVRWQADADVRAAMPLALTEACDGRALLDTCRGLASSALVAELEALVNDKEDADRSIDVALGGKVKGTGGYSAHAAGEVLKTMQHRASPSVLASASVRLAHLVADEILRGAPDNAEALEGALARYHATATSEAVRHARARLQIVSRADAGLRSSVRQSYDARGHDPAQSEVLKAIDTLNSATEKHKPHASPRVAKEAAARVEELEAIADAELQATMGKQDETDGMVAVLDRYRNHATRGAIAFATLTLDRQREADESVTRALHAATAAEGLDDATAKFDALREAITQEATSKTRASPSIVTTAIRTHADLCLRAAPRDQLPLRAALEEHGERTSDDVRARATEMLDELVHSDRALEDAFNESDLLVAVQKLRVATLSFGDLGSPGLAHQAAERLRSLQKDADANLQHYMSHARSDEPSLAHALREGIEKQKAHGATDAALAEVEALLQQVEETDAAIDAARLRAVETGDPVLLREALDKWTIDIPGSPSVRDEAISVLIRLEADCALERAPSDYATLLQAVEKNNKWASPDVLSRAMGRLEAIKTADDALSDTRSLSWRDLERLKAILQEHATRASPCEVDSVKERLRLFEDEADIFLDRALAAEREASEVKLTIEHFHNRATPSAIERAYEMLTLIASADDELLTASELDIHDFLTLDRKIAALRDLASPSIGAIADAALRRMLRALTREADHKLLAATGNREELLSALDKHKLHATPDPILLVKAHVDLLEADAILRSEINKPFEIVNQEVLYSAANNDTEGRLQMLPLRKLDHRLAELVYAEDELEKEVQKNRDKYGAYRLLEYGGATLKQTDMTKRSANEHFSRLLYDLVTNEKDSKAARAKARAEARAAKAQVKAVKAEARSAKVEANGVLVPRAPLSARPEQSGSTRFLRSQRWLERRVQSFNTPKGSAQPDPGRGNDDAGYIAAVMMTGSSSFRRPTTMSRPSMPVLPDEPEEEDTSSDD